MTVTVTGVPSDGHQRAFYDSMAPYYHLIYADWEASIERQARGVDRIIRARWPGGHEVLDAACGIGTQCLGLARLGYAVTGSDLAPDAVARARREAEARGLELQLSVTDMRALRDHHGRQFDAVIACDNAVPHLPDDAEILRALSQLLACTRPGGGCVLSVRDYAAMDRGDGRRRMEPYGVRVEGQRRFSVFQTMDFDDEGRGEGYELGLYIVEERQGEAPVTRVFRTRYYMISIARLMELMTEAGFVELERIDSWLFQPVVVGTRPAG